MKKHSSASTSLILSMLTTLLFFTACEPKEELPNLDDGPKYFLNGEVEMDIANFQETDHTTMVFLDTNTCYVFEKEEHLLAWTGVEEQDAELMAAKRQIRTSVKAIRAFLDKAGENGILENEEELQRLYNRMFGVPGQDLPVSRGLGFLYQHAYYGGAGLAIAKYPRMPSGRDNWASSANIIASTGLYDRTYFRGAGRWLIPGTYPNFTYFGFNDKTSSVF